jgi:hypothetical protein
MSFGVAASPPDTPTVAQPPLWTFRQPFDPKSWSSGTTSVTSFLFRCKSQSFQLIHDHYQRSPTWSSPSEATESATDSLSSRQLAAMLQRQFDEEDHLLVAERAELLAAAGQQRVFDCGVCFDTLPEESIACIDPCGHSFCRECIREFIVSQIESRRFPVLCPTCTAGPGNNRPESIGSYVSIIHYSE